MVKAQAAGVANGTLNPDGTPVDPATVAPVVPPDPATAALAHAVDAVHELVTHPPVKPTHRTRIRRRRG
jgi:hypothetical protein